MSKAATIRDSVTEALDRRAMALATEATALEQIRQHLAALPGQIEQASGTAAEEFAARLEPLARSLAALSTETAEALALARKAMADAQAQATQQAERQGQALASATAAIAGLRDAATTARTEQAEATKARETALRTAARELTQTRQDLLHGLAQETAGAHRTTRRLLAGAILAAVLATASPWLAARWNGSSTLPLPPSQQTQAVLWGQAVAAAWQGLPPAAQALLQREHSRLTGQPGR